jgi:hypothetical protein
MSTSPVNTRVTSSDVSAGVVVGPDDGSSDGDALLDGAEDDGSGVAESDDSLGEGCDVGADDDGAVAAGALAEGETLADDDEHAARSRTSAAPPAAAEASRLARCMQPG